MNPGDKKGSSRAQLTYQLQSSFVHLTSFKIIQSCINSVGNTAKHKTSYKNAENGFVTATSQGRVPKMHILSKYRSYNFTKGTVETLSPSRTV